MDILEQYLKKFKELPELPVMADFGMIYDLMEEAIKRNSPLTQEEINNKVFLNNYDIIN